MQTSFYVIALKTSKRIKLVFLLHNHHADTWQLQDLSLTICN